MYFKKQNMYFISLKNYIKARQGVKKWETINENTEWQGVKMWETGDPEWQVVLEQHVKKRE